MIATMCYCISYPVPGTPTNLMISPPSGSCDQLMVTWTAPSNTGGPGAVSVTYKVYLDGAMQGSSLNTTSTTLTGLMDNTEYTVSVEAVNVAGSGERVTKMEFTRPKGYFSPTLCNIKGVHIYLKKFMFMYKHVY